MSRSPHAFFALAAACLSLCSARGDDWPAWGRDLSRNAVSPEKSAPLDFAFDVKDTTGAFTSHEKGILWSARIGSQTMASPVVANGLVWVGTDDNKTPILACFRESDGKPLYRYVSPHLKHANAFEDFSWSGITSTPTVEGDRLWLINNRTEVICVDIAPLTKGTGEPRPVWRVDLRKEFKVVPNYPLMHSAFQASVAVYKDWVYAVTGNGIDDSFTKVRAPDAPSLVCLEKTTGKLVWQDNSPGKKILAHQISSPVVLETNGRAQVIVGQGDGWLRSFDPATGKVLWKCDLNAKDAKFELGSKGNRNYVVATPIAYDGRVYVATGRQIEAAFGGEGWLYCIDPTKNGDVSLELEEKPGQGKPNPNSAVVWRYGGRDPDPNSKRDFLFGRSISNCVAHDGLLYAADVDGYFFCFDAVTGKIHWVQDLESTVWGIPFFADGKVYVASDEDIWVFAHGKRKKLLRRIELPGFCHTSPILANGVIFLPLPLKLFAIGEKK